MFCIFQGNHRLEPPYDFVTKNAKTGARRVLCFPLVLNKFVGEESEVPTWTKCWKKNAVIFSLYACKYYTYMNLGKIFKSGEWLTTEKIPDRTGAKIVLDLTASPITSPWVGFGYTELTQKNCICSTNYVGVVRCRFSFIVLLTPLLVGRRENSEVSPNFYS